MNFLGLEVHLHRKGARTCECFIAGVRATQRLSKPSRGMNAAASFVGGLFGGLLEAAMADAAPPQVDTDDPDGSKRGLEP